MVLEWREREHGVLDAEVMESDEALKALRLCGLYKLFEMNGMHAQIHMLEMLVGYWDLDQEVFMIDGKPLSLEVEDIYFLTRLSCRGEVASMEARNIGGLTIDEHVTLYCAPGSQKIETQIPFKDIIRLDL